MIERRVRIEQEEHPDNPREGCNVGRMLCWHSRYNLGDDHDYDSDNWKRELACEVDSSLEEKLEELEENVWNTVYECLICDGNYVGKCRNEIMEIVNHRVGARCKALIDKAFDDGYFAMPLFLYDHSGITISAGRFDCPWDSGCVGVIICTKQQVQEEWAGDEEKAEKWLRSEIETYDDYLTGNVWGYICEEKESGGCNGCNRPHDWEEVDSCWGFYGDPGCMKSEILDDFADAFDSAIVEYN